MSTARDSFSKPENDASGSAPTHGHKPAYLRVADPIVGRVIGAGLPSGVNELLTVRGRKSGLPRITPVAVVKLGGRRWILGQFGESDWVRNLRAAGHATLTAAGTSRQFSARQLSKGEASAFFGEVLKTYFTQFPPVVRSIMPVILGVRHAIKDPDVGAERHPVFEMLDSNS